MAIRRLMILLVFITAPAVSMAQLSGNVGYVSDYIYRGIYQEDSSASAGLDYEHESGMYVGTWAADVGDGLEYDLYFGTGGDLADTGFSWSAGFTGYYYTNDWDNTYQEINLGLGYGAFSLDVALGDYDASPASQDYSFTSLGYDFGNGIYASVGAHGGDVADGEVLEVGYGFDFMGLDLSVALIAVGGDLAGSQDASAGNLAGLNMFFSVNRSISIGGE